ncbi:MAG: hypothetical protein AAGF30_00285 [Pseudomonadota bacterium]
MRLRTEIDGSYTLTLDDARRFVIRCEDDGTVSLESFDGDILIHPISRTKIEIDTPLQ